MNNSLRYVMLTIALLCLTTVFAAAPTDTIAENRLTADVAFKQLPADYLELLDGSQRFEMVEYYKYRPNDVKPTKNKKNGLSKIELMNADFIRVQITESSRLELRIITDNRNRQIVVAVYTIYGPAQESEISFFDSNLNPLAADKLFKRPELKHFFSIPKGCVTTTKEIEQMLPYTIIGYTLSPDSDDITARLSVEEIMNIEDYNLIKLFIKPQITYHWDSKKYKQTKEN